MLLTTSITLVGQAPPQDCIGAIPLCQDVIFQPLSSNNSGNLPNEVGFGGCLVSGEQNSLWYIFTIGQDGDLSFTITPEDNDDDYDWGLYDITNAECSDIPNDPSLMVSCNSWGANFGGNGPTGISTAQGGTGNSNGPGDTNGPPFNADFSVVTGQTFVLMVSDFSSTPAGYTIDFGESTAELFDATEPEITDITPSCSSITISFSENIDCTSLDFGDFEVTQNGTTYSVSSINSACDGNDTFTDEIELFFTPDLPANGEDFTFSVLDGLGSVTDLCGNQVAVSNITVTLNIGLEAEVSVTGASCNTSDGVIEVTNVTGGTMPYTYALDGVMQSSATFSSLSSGEYTVTVTDDDGCSTNLQVSVDGVNGVTFSAGTDDISCSMEYTLQASVSDGFTGSWTSLDDVTFNNPSSPTSIINSNVTGQTTLNWAVTDGNGCDFEESINITFTNLDADISIGDALCAGICDGTAEVQNISGGATPYICDWGDGSTPNAACTINSLCAGDNTLSITDFNGCEFVFDYSINQTTEFYIDSVKVEMETCKGDCDGSIEVYCDDAISYSINDGFSYSSTSVFAGVCNGFYPIIVRDVNNCEATEDVYVGFPTPPYASFVVTQPVALWSDPVFEMENNSENYISSAWEFGYPSGLIFSTEENAIYHSPTSDLGEYQIQLVVEDEIGCTDSTLRTVIIRDDVLIYIPNSFTPNEDGINDLFKPVVNEADPNTFVFSIYDRYGHLVFQTKEIGAGWNGSGYDNKDFYVANGVYNWRLEFKGLHDSDRYVEVGNVLVVR